MAARRDSTKYQGGVGTATKKRSADFPIELIPESMLCKISKRSQRKNPLGFYLFRTVLAAARTSGSKGAL
ncbi:hypothetical protein CCUG62472_03965 [Mycobacteroides salmoniphilum]|nr:hypothetical protein CCUG62472_03965 [Mycobacteroides salmoniphilum]